MVIVRNLVRQPPWRAQVGTLAYIVSFALGAGPVPGLLVPEITPTALRGARPALLPCKTVTGVPCASRKNYRVLSMR